MLVLILIIVNSKRIFRKIFLKVSRFRFISKYELSVDSSYDILKNSLSGNGKRFRPILVHLAGRANNADPDSLMKIALAVELLHNFTLQMRSPGLLVVVSVAFIIIYIRKSAHKYFPLFSVYISLRLLLLVPRPLQEQRPILH